MISTCLLLAFMVMATVTDIQQQKIFNWTTYPGIVLAIVVAAAATLMQRPEIAIVGIGQSALGLLACGGLMLVCFALFQIGGGDVKLLAMAGAFLGPALGMETILWTFVLGGAMAVLVLIWKLGAVHLVRSLYQQVMCRCGFGEWSPLSEDEKKQLQLPLYLAPSALLAVAIVRFSLVETLLSRLS